VAGETTTVKFAALGIETELAIQVMTQDGREIWIPFSTIHRIDRSHPPSITMEAWLAEKEDL
jgi:hypothetical protein